MQSIEDVRTDLLSQVASSDTPRDVLRSPELKSLYGQLTSLPTDKRSEFGKAVNELKIMLESAISAKETELENSDVEILDVTAPWDVNSEDPQLLPTEQGTQHPLTKELAVVIDIFTRMGFEAICDAGAARREDGVRV